MKMNPFVKALLSSVMQSTIIKQPRQFLYDWEKDTSTISRLGVF